MTYAELLKQAKEKLEAAGINEFEASNSAWILMSETFGISRSEYLFGMMDDIEDNEQNRNAMERFDDLLEMRAARIPLQQILGSWNFMGYDFLVNEHVLCPRPETELLVSRADKLVPDGGTVLDMCTGSGCIILSLMRHKLDMGETIIGVGADLSEEALAVAGANAETFRAELEEGDQWNISFVKSDMFSEITGKYDCIVSNPPYIRPDVIETLEPEVRDHEPRMALDGGEDGLTFYRILAEKAPKFLKKGGHLVMEIGFDQGEDVKALLESAGFSDVTVSRDYAGLDRIVCGRYMA